MWHVGVTWDFGSGDLMERDHLEELSVDRSVVLKCAFKKWDQEVWNAVIWLRIGAGGGRLWMR
jgi:hypothetical protein